MKRKIVIITGSGLRHKYFRVLLSNSEKIQVLRSFCEYEVSNSQKRHLFGIEKLHFESRDNTEHDYFSDAVEILTDKSNPKLLEKGLINTKKYIEEIVKLNPDLIITYGCSIIKPSLIDTFPKKIINVHLGLSPYYYGSGTNFHPLVEEKPFLVGYTFMYIDYGIDTGQIIHQKRATIFAFDNPHQIGTRLIKDMSHDMVKLIENFDKVKTKKSNINHKGKTYKMRDITINHYKKIYDNFKNNMCQKYLKNKIKTDKKYPIIEQKFLRS